MISGTGVKDTLLETMAMAKPVVCTTKSTGGIEIISGQNAVIADDPQDFALKVIELLRDDGLRQWIAAEARRSVMANHSWEILTDRLNGLFEEVTAKSRIGDYRSFEQNGIKR
jgi:glycosyltransferase involved in cell wall biosynthesis